MLNLALPRWRSLLLFEQLSAPAGQAALMIETCLMIEIGVNFDLPVVAGRALQHHHDRTSITVSDIRRTTSVRIKDTDA